MEKLNYFEIISRRLYYFLFVERFNKKINFNFPSNFSRIDMVKYLIKRKNYKKYLEIGCDLNQLFSEVKIEKKIGVDPESGGNIRTTSDKFFETNTANFDLIFIDGLHEYEQVKRDIINSLKYLNDDGIILVHDCLPKSLSRQAVPRYKIEWNGDVWKAIVDLRRNKNLEIFTCEVDQGIGVIQKKENSSILILEKEIKKLKFKDFYNEHRKFMRIISLDEFYKLFN